jgi:hypothetical protein
MFRKLALAAAATVALGTAALVPTTASAHWHGGGGWHGGWGGHHAWGPRVIYRAPVYAGYNGCLRPRWVPTPWGPRRRLINVCY